MLCLKTNTGQILLNPEDGTGDVNVDVKRLGLGKILQVQAAQTNARSSYTVSVLTAITGLEVDIIPKSKKSKLLLDACLSYNLKYVTSTGFLIDEDYITDHPSNTNASYVLSTQYDGTNNNSQMYTGSLRYLYTPLHRGSIKVQVGIVSSWSTSNYTVYVNDGSSNDRRGISTLRVWEIEG